MSYTNIIKPTVGDPLIKEKVDALIDNDAYLKSVQDAIVDQIMILNGSFEADTDSDGIPDQWTRNPYNGGTVAIDATDAQHGINSVEFVSPGGGGNGGGELESAEFFEVSPLSPVWLRWAMKSSVADVKNEVIILWYDAAQDPASTASTTLYSEATNNPTAWTELDGWALPPSDARYAKVQLIGCKDDDATAGSTWFDNVRAMRPQFLRRAEFVTAGTFTFFAPVTGIYRVKSVGGGGGAQNTANGTGGGAGGTGISFVMLAASSAHTVVVGTGGAVGSAGVDSTFDTTTVVGDGGAVGTASPGVGGASNTGQITINGGAGGPSGAGNGHGGVSSEGYGGASNGGGNAGSGTRGGGGAGASGTASAGAPGAVIIEW